MRVAWLQTSWQFVRRLSGDDAYEHYLSRRAVHDAQCGHAEAENGTNSAPLSRSDFYRQRLLAQWSSIKRCC